VPRVANSGQRRARRVQITPRDRELLAFISGHRLIDAGHARAFLGVSASTAYARLRALTQAGLLDQQFVFHRQPACHLITSRGLAAIGSSLPVPRVDPGVYRHDIGVAWLWLAARQGAFGPVREIVTERAMRSRDGPGRRSDPPLAVRLGGVGRSGHERLHYPDVLLGTADGRRIAIELELSGKGRTRRERILSAYGADPRVDGVLYLVENGAVGRAISASARRLGISSLVRVQRIRMPDQGSPARDERAAQRAPASRSGTEVAR
jgi:hypothetical protein